MVVQDRVPPHNARRVTNYLAQIFSGKTISNNGEICWPAHSPDNFLFVGNKEKILPLSERNKKQEHLKSEPFEYLL